MTDQVGVVRAGDPVVRQGTVHVLVDVFRKERVDVRVLVRIQVHGELGRTGNELYQNWPATVRKGERRSLLA